MIKSLLNNTLQFFTIFIAIITSAVIRFSNADLTETQLFIKYWYFWLIVGAVVPFNMWIIAVKEQDRLDRQYETFSNQLRGLGKSDD